MKGLAFALALSLLIGCSPARRMSVYNNAGVVVSLHIDRDSGTAGWEDKLVQLSQGWSQSYHPAKLIHDDFTVRLTAGRCEYGYRLPAAHWPDVQFDNPYLVQLEPDLVLYLRAPGAQASAREQLQPFQRGGFPLKPISKTCS